ncbi:uncharacterized protein LOC105190161 isoform X2 [Harpegnathos saltator]|nr:uncharacterized protein LOC105190161 isoform X2 [Harpegnathos saltator]
MTGRSSARSSASRFPLGRAHADTDDLASMTVRRGRSSWPIIAIAVLVLVASASSASGSAKFRKPRKWLTTKSPHSHSRPMIVRVTDQLPDDELTLHSAKGIPDCAGDSCRNAAAAFDFGEARSSRNDLVPNERYIVYPKQYERFVSRKSPGGHHASRYKRYVVFSDIPSPNASDIASIARPANTSETSPNDRVTLTRVPLYSTGYAQVRTRRSLAAGDNHPAQRNASETSPKDRVTLTRVPLYRTGHAHLRTRRSLAAGDSYPARRNASDYYAERRAVMARFYARQRAIEARYGNLTSSPPSSDNGTSREYPLASNVTLFRLYPSKNSSASINRATFRQPSITIDPMYSNLPVKRPDGRPVFGSRTWNNSNVDRQAVRYYYTTPVPCANASLSGTFAPKKRSKIADNCTDSADSEEEVDDDRTMVVGRPDNDNGTVHRIWGRCKGKVVYQHNLLLGLKGPSTLDTVFEVIIQGPVCITCVEALRYNETKAKVTFVSGGRGHEYVKLKLQGFENEGFSYIIKVWGIKRFAPDCRGID